MPDKRQSSKVKSFIKLESYDEVKEARWINSRVDDFKAFAGPYFKIVEDVLFARPEFIKHVPVPDRPALINAMEQAGLKYYSTDFTAFESHFTPEFMRACECKLYTHVLGDNVYSRYMNDVITGNNVLKTRLGMTFQVQGRRMSGDMCTSLGNGFSNLMLAYFVYYSASGKIDLEGFTAYVEGDDGLFASPVPLTGDMYLPLGFTIKMDEIRSPREASFCGLLCSPDNCVIKDPRRVFRSFGWTSSFIDAGPAIMDSLLKSKALSLCYELPQCPILGVLGRVALRKTQKTKLTHRHESYRETPLNFEIPEFAPSQETRDFFAQQFSISAELQLEVEEAIVRGDMETVSGLIPPTPDDTWYTSSYIELG